MAIILEDDKVWFDEPLKLEHLAREVSTLHTNGANVLLLAHFESTLDQLTLALRNQNIPFERFASLNPADLCGASPGKIWLGLARGFQLATSSLGIPSGSTLQVLVAEHHPLFSSDEKIRQTAALLPCEVELTFYFSLDDPLLQHFGADSIKRLIERLGADKNEALSNHLINTAIRTAQEKIEGQVPKEMPTYSAADWFKYNLRP